MIGLERNTEKNHFQSRLYTIELRLVCSYVNVKLLNMTTRNELCLEQKINLIQEKENGLSHRLLREKFHISIGALSNILNIHLIHILKLFSHIVYGMYKFNE